MNSFPVWNPGIYEFNAQRQLNINKKEKYFVNKNILTHVLWYVIVHIVKILHRYKSMLYSRIFVQCVLQFNKYILLYHWYNAKLDEAIQLAYKTSAIILGCPIASEIKHGWVDKVPFNKYSRLPPYSLYEVTTIHNHITNIPARKFYLFVGCR
jgi:hypothetical protein